MANGIAEIETLALQLEDEQPQYAAVMDAMAMKSRHFAAYSASVSRDRKGRRGGQ